MDIEQSVAIMKALADTSRMRIARLLASGPRCVEEIANRLDLATSTVSFHLKKLEQAGLVNCTKQQYYSIYSLSPDFGMLDMKTLIGADDSEAARQDSRELAYRRKVLSAFMRGGRLMQIPVQYKKMRIVLEEIAGRFEPGRDYTEKEVNEIINRVHEDHCTIRRCMIVEGLMKRDTRHIYRLCAPPQADKLSAPKASAAAAQKTGATKMDRRKELKRAYLETGTTAGIVCVRCKANGRMLLMMRKDINGFVSRVRFALEAGGYFKTELQKDWNKYGENEFEFEVLDTLKKEDLADKNPDDELRALMDLWRDKLAAPPSNATFY